MAAEEDDNHSLTETCRLSHAMLKVQSVNDAVSYWTQKGGKVLQSRKDGDGKFLSSFVALGNGKTTDNCFALELVRSEKDTNVGNVINYIGVSLLLQFQGNLQGLISGQNKAQGEGAEPHGIPVKSCASSPGDFLSRICLKSNNLEQTRAFYQDLLGMQVAAADDSQLCLRYQHGNDDDDSSVETNYGVPTTLVFEGTNEKLDHGTCLDHLAVRTTSSIHRLHDDWLSRQDNDDNDNGANVNIYLNPTEMFGMTVMGIRDPNGYKVVLAGPA